MLGGNQSGLS